MALQDDNFRDFLARRYSRRPAVVSFIEMPSIGLNEAQLPNEGSTQDLWHAVLRLVRKEGTFDQLVAEVTKQYEKDAELIRKLSPAWRDDREAAPVAINLANPYPGLRPYEESDHERFYGRERWIVDLTNALDQHGFVTLYGGSGSGKSSLLRAGLIPRLKKQGRAVILFTPGKNPFDSLLAMGLGNRSQAQSLIEQAQKGLQVDLFAEIAAQCFPGQKLLVIMDQGEELFTRCESAEVRERFLECLFHDRGPKTNLLIGIREDFFDRWGKTPALSPTFGAANISLTPPDEGDWRSIILEPAQKHGVIFEAGLPEIMIERLRVARAGLPLLQFLLQKLWEHDNPSDGVLNQESYDSLGGIDHALRGHIEAFLKKHAGRETEIRQMLFKLVRFTRQDGQYRALSRSCPPQELPADLTAAMMSDQWRILTTRGQAGEVELSHEVLLRVWPGFEQLEQQRGALHALKGDITEACARWQPTRQKSELWAGSRLEESLRRAGLPGLVDDATTSDDFALAETPLSEGERDFLQTSRAKVISDRQFQKRLLRIATATAAVMLLIAAGAAFFWQDANTQKLRSQELTRDVIIKSASSRGNDETLEVIRSLAQRPDILSSWEGRFLTKRFGFAPIKLQRNELGMLDSGPLKGSGLYQAAHGLFDTKDIFMEERVVSVNGLRFVNGDRRLFVYQEKGQVPLLTLSTTEGGSFVDLWVAPDLSCFLLKASPINMTSFVVSEGLVAEHDEPDIVYLIPLRERFCSSALLPNRKEAWVEKTEAETEQKPQPFTALTLEAGGGRFLFASDDEYPGAKRFFLNLSEAESPCPEIEVAAPLVADQNALAAKVRFALPKEKQAAYDQWIAQGVQIHCVDWSRPEIEVGADLGGQFLVGPASAPDQMKKLSLPESRALEFWDGENRSSQSLALEFSGDGRHLLAFPYANQELALISRESMTVSKLFSRRNGTIFPDYFDLARIRLGSSPAGSLLWISCDFNSRSETCLFVTETGEAGWSNSNAPIKIDTDVTGLYTAQNLGRSNEIVVQKGRDGPVVALVSAKVSRADDMIRESPVTPAFIMVGDKLMRKHEFTEVMPLPAGVVLAPDWSWAAYLTEGNDSESTQHEKAPWLHVLRGLNESGTTQQTLADRALAFQIHWYSSPEAQQQLRTEIALSLEAREEALMSRFGWPRRLPLLTQAAFEEKRRLAPEIMAEADAILQASPTSEAAMVLKSATSFLITENVSAAVREIESRLLESPGNKGVWYFPAFEHEWTELALLVQAKGGRFSAKLALQVDLYPDWHLVECLRNGTMSPDDFSFLIQVRSIDLRRALHLVLAHQAHRQGDVAEAQGWLTLSRLEKEPPAWITSSFQARSLVQEPGSMLYWLTFCPADMMKSLDDLFRSTSPDPNPHKAALALAKSLYDKNESAQGERIVHQLLTVPGFEYEAANFLVQRKGYADASIVRVPDDAPVEMKLGWLGRQALTVTRKGSLQKYLEQFTQLSGGRSQQQLSDIELRGHTCLLIALGKKDEAKEAIKLLQNRQPKLLDLGELRWSSWTEKEGQAIYELMEPPSSN